MLDIRATEAQFAPEDEGTPLEIVGLDGEVVMQDDGVTPVTITITGMNSETYRDAQNWQRKAIRARRGRPMTAAEENASLAEFVARCCKGWAGFTDNGQAVPFSTAACANMFVRLPFVQRQVEQAMAQPDFFRTPSAS